MALLRRNRTGRNRPCTSRGCCPGGQGSSSWGCWQTGRLQSAHQPSCNSGTQIVRHKTCANRTLSLRLVDSHVKALSPSQSSVSHELMELSPAARAWKLRMSWNISVATRNRQEKSPFKMPSATLSARKQRHTQDFCQ